MMNLAEKKLLSRSPLLTYHLKCLSALVDFKTFQNVAMLTPETSNVTVNVV